MTRAGLVAPAAQAQPAQLATGACAEGGLFGAVKPIAVAVLGGLPVGAAVLVDGVPGVVLCRKMTVSF